MTAGEILEEWLDARGYFGLCNPYSECECAIDEVSACPAIGRDCVAVYAFRCDKCVKAEDCERRDRTYKEDPYPTLSNIKNYCYPKYEEYQ